MALREERERATTDLDREMLGLEIERFMGYYRPLEGVDWPLTRRW